MGHKASIETRFWQKVTKTDGCWVWNGALSRAGYPVLGDGAAKTVYGHRVSYELANGSIPAGRYVCHTCDNRACVNPAHLFAGTPKDNMQDCVRKGRLANGSRPGELHSNAILSEQDVLAIRAALASGVKSSSLQVQYGVSKSNIQCIKHRRSWRHV